MQYPSDERPGRRGLPQSRTRITDPATSASTYAIRGARNRTWRRYSPGRGCSLRQEWREKEPEVVQQASVKVFLRVGVPSGAASARMLSFFFIESLYLLIIFSCQCVFIKTKVLTCLQLQFRMWEFSRYLRKKWFRAGSGPGIRSPDSKDLYFHNQSRFYYSTANEVLMMLIWEKCANLQHDSTIIYMCLWISL